MKRFVNVVLILFLIIGYVAPSAAKAATYPLTITFADTSITAVMTGVPAATTKYRLDILRAPFSAIAAQNTENTVQFGTMSDRTKSAINGTVTWQLSGLNPNGTYYIRAVALQSVETLPGEPVTSIQLFANGTLVDTPIESSWPLVESPMPGRDNQYIFKGGIDTVKNTDYGTSTYRPVLYVSSSAFISDTDTGGSTGRIYEAYRDPFVSNPTKGINPDGTYYFKDVIVTPSQTYYLKQIITRNNTKTKVEVGTFNTKDGFIAAGSPQEQEINDNKTYYLLAPWPGLSALMDPDLCYQKKFIDKTIPEDAICDVNGFLDFAFKLLIGLTAVILVLRLMFEGYQYVVTDIPFLKASAKGNFFTALLGLLLALSAYLILNTINPKLVNNTISIDGVSVGVEEVYDRADDPEFMSRLDSISTTGITADINDKTFLAYLAHQQGVGGANAILQAAKENRSASSKITNNMSTNFNRRDAQKTIGTTELTPVNFLKYWSVKVRAFKQNPRGSIPDSINTQLVRVAQETGIALETLQIMCRIESGCSSTSAISVVNSYGYAGLFQLSNKEHVSKKSGKYSGDVWETYKKPGGVLLDAYHNAYAAAQLMKANLSRLRL